MIEQLKQQRVEIKNMVKNAYTYFSVYQSDYSSIEGIKKQIQNNKKSQANGRFVLGLFALIFAANSFMNVFLTSINPKTGKISLSSDHQGSIILLAIFISLSILFFWSHAHFNKTKKIKLDILSNQLSDVIQKLSNAYEAFEDKDLLHFKYSDPRIISKLYQLIDEGRADSLKEAINLLHEGEKETVQLRNQEQILDRMDRARRNNAIVGTAAVLAILFTGGRD